MKHCNELTWMPHDGIGIRWTFTRSDDVIHKQACPRHLDDPPAPSRAFAPSSDQPLAPVVITPVVSCVSGRLLG
jgi:hypothetical protein